MKKKCVNLEERKREEEHREQTCLGKMAADFGDVENMLPFQLSRTLLNYADVTCDICLFSNIFLSLY